MLIFINFMRVRSNGDTIILFAALRFWAVAGSRFARGHCGAQAFWWHVAMKVLFL